MKITIVDVFNECLKIAYYVYSHSSRRTRTSVYFYFIEELNTLKTCVNMKTVNKRKCTVIPTECNANIYFKSNEWINWNFCIDQIPTLSAVQINEHSFHFFLSTKLLVVVHSMFVLAQNHSIPIESLMRSIASKPHTNTYTP